MIGHINSIETMGLVDGPGIRVVVFLEGCPLRCVFCHNPETWFVDNKNDMDAKSLVDYICRFKNYFGNDGGVTFSGGEPLVQHDFLLECLKLCKEKGINTCLDTSGSCDNFKDILEYCDLIIYDIKALDADCYYDITGNKIDNSLAFLRECQKQNKALWIRQVIVPGINDNEGYILRLKKYISKISNVCRVELLPYHLLGVDKYKKLGIAYKLDGVPEMSHKKCDELYRMLIDVN